MKKVKILRKIIISLSLGLVTYAGYYSVFFNSDITKGTIPAFIAAGTAFTALLSNDLVEAIKKK